MQYRDSATDASSVSSRCLDVTCTHHDKFARYEVRSYWQRAFEAVKIAIQYGFKEFKLLQILSVAKWENPGLNIESQMGTELNYFHLLNGEELRFADRRLSPPKSFHEICNGYEYFIRWANTSFRYKGEIYDKAYSEFIIDCDKALPDSG